MRRRVFIAGLSGAAAMPLVLHPITLPAMAQNYPIAPVKLVVTTGAGSAPDVIARIVAE
jgi:tripartite-type tricarboxylate transporter receptor subunit TctC